nr:uncharacterized protein LOC129261986 [Lytechinus pictus]
MRKMRRGMMTKRQWLFILVIVNGVFLYLNFKVLTIDDIRQFSEELSSNLRKIRLLEHTYAEQWSSIANDKVVEERGGEGKEFVWEKVENLHLALPAYEKMRHTLSRLQDFQFLFSKRVNQIRISQEMLTYKSVLWRGDVERLQDIFVDVLQTNRSIKVGLIGGSLSASGQTICPDRACLFIDHVRKWLEKVLQTDVTLHNAAISFANSDYFAWCTEPHLDVDDMDIVIWELATDDYVMRAHNDKLRYDHAAQPQELLTRHLKELPTKPFLMYVNFMSPENIRNRDCVNSEYYAGRHLSRHYNVTSVSWCAAVCSSLWQLGFTPDELIHSGDLLSERAHEQAGLFVINFMKSILKSVTFHHMNLTRTNGLYLQKLVELHDVFMANSKEIHKRETHQLQQPDFNAIWNRNTKRDVLNSSGDITSKTDLSKPTKSVPKPVKNVMHINTSGRHFMRPERRLNQRSRFPAKWIHNSQCWPLSKPQFIPDRTLALSRNDGWDEGISDKENWYTSMSSQKIIEFSFEMAPPLPNRTCILALAVMACDYCGQALAWLDNHFDDAVLVGGKYGGHAFRVIEVMTDVPTGRHTFNLKSLEDMPFKLSAVMVGHKDNAKF